MKPTLLVFFIASLCLVPRAEAQVGRQMALLNSPAYEAAASQLRDASPRQYNFSRAVLSDVLRLMAEDAGISFFGLPDGSEAGDKLVTFTIEASPFTALETLAKANNISLIYENGIWYLRPANDQELIGRIYEINYNAQELVKKNSQTTSASGAPGGGSSGGSGGLATAGNGLDLQGSPDFFVTEPSRILEDIRNILDIRTTGRNATIAPTASVDNVAQMSLGQLQGTPDVAAGSGGRPEGDEAGEAKVIWNSDSNTLYVVATRQQHQWIEAYLASADRPQPMIAIEVKFLETSRNPRSELGIDWDGALGENGLEIDLKDASGPIDLNSVGDYALPTAVLSYSDLNLKLRALFDDRHTKTVSYPRMVTLDNREVSFRSVVNQPVLGSSASTSLGAGATQTSSVEYLPIGTVINILPKRMADGKIHLNVSVTVSDIVGTEVINGNPFPIATSRVYTAPLTVKSGYTVAISGLDAARTDENERGVPVLGRLPVLGYAFKKRRNDRSRQHLMMLITPVLLNGATEGLSKKPVTREPWKNAPSATAHPKGPVVGEPRTNADLPDHGQPRAEPIRSEPIRDVPQFDDPVSARKANHTFGSKPEPTVAEAKPVDADVAERTLSSDATAASGSGQSSGSAPVPSALNTPVIVEEGAVIDGPSAAEASAAPAPSTAGESAGKARASSSEAEDGSTNVGAAETETGSSPTLGNGDAPERSARVSEMQKELDQLRAKLDSIPEGDDRLSPDDGQMVVNVFNRTEELLKQVDAVRGDENKPLQGDLGDVWWDLINAKTRAVKLSRRAPESLAVQLESTAE